MKQDYLKCFIGEGKGSEKPVPLFNLLKIIILHFTMIKYCDIICEINSKVIIMKNLFKGATQYFYYFYFTNYSKVYLGYPANSIS